MSLHLLAFPLFTGGPEANQLNLDTTLIAALPALQLV